MFEELKELELLEIDGGCRGTACKCHQKVILYVHYDGKKLWP